MSSRIPSVGGMMKLWWQAPGGRRLPQNAIAMAYRVLQLWKKDWLALLLLVSLPTLLAVGWHLMGAKVSQWPSWVAVGWVFAGSTPALASIARDRRPGVDTRLTMAGLHGGDRWAGYWLAALPLSGVAAMGPLIVGPFWGAMPMGIKTEAFAWSLGLGLPTLAAFAVFLGAWARNPRQLLGMAGLLWCLAFLGLLLVDGEKTFTRAIVSCSPPFLLHDLLQASFGHIPLPAMGRLLGLLLLGSAVLGTLGFALVREEEA